MLLQIAEILDASDHLGYRYEALLMQVCGGLRAVFLHRKASPAVLAFLRRLRRSVRTYGRLGMYVHDGPVSFMVVGHRVRLQYAVSIQGRDRLGIQCFLPPRPYEIRLSALRYADGHVHGWLEYWGQTSGVAYSCPFEVDEIYPWRFLAYVWQTE